MRRVPALLLTAALVVPDGLLAGCTEEPQQEYCETVRDRQEELTELTADGGPTALLAALDVFRDLRSEAPSDISDEWQVVVSRLEALDDALADAGVDPADYEAGKPPPGVTDEEQARIEAAAEQLVDDDTRVAFEGLQQQARDVCKTSLTL